MLAWQNRETENENEYGAILSTGEQFYIFNDQLHDARGGDRRPSPGS